MDPKTQITMVHNNSVLEASHYSFEENLVFALVREYPDATERELANIALNAFVNMPGDIATHAADGAREGGSSPNTALGAALGMVGEARARAAMAVSSLLCELFQYTTLATGTEKFDLAPVLDLLTKEQRESFVAKGEDPRAQEMLAAIGKMGGRSVFVDLVNEASGGQPSAAALLGAIWTTVGWASLRKTRITKETLRTLPWYSQIFSAMVGCSVPAAEHRLDSFCGTPLDELLQKWTFTEATFKVLMHRRPSPAEVSELKLLLALIISNGPGTISAQGCKGAVSADGPEDPERVQINKAFMGFLTHSGFAHGGNGYEAIGFLLEMFDGVDLNDACESKQPVPLQEMADRYSKRYADYKSTEKEKGNLGYKKIPCINHPVFKGKKVNLDPREQFASRLLEANGRHNIFLAFYQQLVRSLHAKKVTPNVYAVNVDAVIASILLRIVWSAYRQGRMQEKEIETAAFTAFLFGRMIGCAAEIDDHLNRGRNMDTRTPASECRFVG
jgi:hypothetical protein